MRWALSEGSNTYADGCKIILDGENKDVNAAYIEGPNGKLYPELKSDIPDLDKSWPVCLIRSRR